MTTEHYEEFIQNCFRLSAVGTEFMYRLTVLGLAALEGHENRAARLNAQCGAPAMQQLSYLSSGHGLTKLIEEQSKLVLACGKACAEEAGNLAQVLLVTQEELRHWTQRILTSWEKLTTGAALSPQARRQTDIAPARATNLNRPPPSRPSTNAARKHTLLAASAS